MELNHLSKYTINRVSDIFDVQIHHIMVYLVRYRFTRQQYYERKVKWTLQFGAWQTALQWMILLALMAMTTKQVPLLEEYLVNCRQATRIPEYEFFGYTQIVAYSVTEIVWFDSLSEVLAYQSGMLEVAYELSDSLEVELNQQEKGDLMSLFVQMTFIFGIAYKLATFSVIILPLQVCFHNILQYVAGQLAVSQLLLFSIFFILTYGYSVVTLSLGFIIFPHVLLILKVFSFQMARCACQLAFAHRHVNCLLLSRFAANYLALHRHVQMYNVSYGGQLALYDGVFKLSGLLTLTYFTKKKDHLNLFAYVALSLYALVYTAFHWKVSSVS